MNETDIFKTNEYKGKSRKLPKSKFKTLVEIGITDTRTYRERKRRIEKKGTTRNRRKE